MLSNTFLKTLFDKRWSTLIWFLVFAAFCVFIVVLFPTFKDSFGEALKDTPDSLKSLLGEASDYQNINGFIDIQVINQMIFMTIIMSVVLGTALLAGEETSGSLQTLLTQPISRTKVYWSKFAALAALTLIACAGIFIGTWVGGLLIGEAGNLNLTRLLQATLMTWLVTLLFAALAFMIGGINGRKGLAGIVTGFLAFTLYIITALSNTAEFLKSINNLSPFKYFNTPSVMKTGLDVENLIILTAATIVIATIGWLVFRRRDVYQQ